MYSIHYHIKMHESTLNSMHKDDEPTEKQIFTIGLMNWFKKKRA
jgi:hypothetical protein